MKVCTKCGESKPATVEFFAKNSSSSSGLQSSCKQCNKDYYEKNKQKILEARERERKEKPDVVAARLKKHYDKKGGKKFRFSKENPPTHRTCLKCGVVHENTPEFFCVARGVTLNKCRDCRRVGVDRAKERARRRKSQAKLRKDPVGNLKINLRKRISTVLSQRGWTKKSSLGDIIGTDWEGLKLHIESQFLPGMSWENRSEWHVDHIVPLATAKTEEDVVKLNHYTNLRPLWAIDNLKKGAKMDYC